MNKRLINILLTLSAIAAMTAAVGAAVKKDLQIVVAIAACMFVISALNLALYINQPKSDFWKARKLRGEPVSNRLRLFGFVVLPASTITAASVFGIYVPPAATELEQMFLIMSCLYGLVAQAFAVEQLVRGLHWQGADQTYIQKIATKTPAKTKKATKQKKQNDKIK